MDLKSRWAEWLRFSEEDAHYEITERCLKILLNNIPSHGTRFKISPLMDYAARYWHKHYLQLAGCQGLLDAANTARGSLERHLSINKDVSQLNKQITELLNTKTRAFTSWLAFYNPDDDPDDDPASLDWESAWKYEDRQRYSNLDDGDSGSEKSSDHDSENGDGIRGRTKRGASAVYYAVKLGLPEIAIQIIKQQKPGIYMRRAGRELCCNWRSITSTGAWLTLC